MAEDFYKAFEDKFRGSRDEIKQRLRVYLPFLRALKSTETTELECLDIGCGRGEWLELLAEEGFAPKGVDLNEAMVRHCQSIGLNAEFKDALVALKQTQSSTLCVVSGFHIAEHLPFDTLREIVQEAHRVLKPCGLLILETPNPENLMVGGHYFYLDPTHSKPIPMQLLAFVAEYYGFARVSSLRLNAAHSNHRGLLMVLSNVSPDYAVVGQKQTETEYAHLFDELFKIETGTSLAAATNDYDKNIVKIQEQVAGHQMKIEIFERKFEKIAMAMRPHRFVLKKLSSLNHRESQFRASKFLRISFGFATKSLTKIWQSSEAARKIINAVLPKKIRSAVKHIVGTRTENNRNGRASPSTYANDFYDSLKSARARK
jgi:O-antigen chain-terminating methyltransferase